MLNFKALLQSMSMVFFLKVKSNYIISPFPFHSSTPSIYSHLVPHILFFFSIQYTHRCKHTCTCMPKCINIHNVLICKYNLFCLSGVTCRYMISKLNTRYYITNQGLIHGGDYFSRSQHSLVILCLWSDSHKISPFDVIGVIFVHFLFTHPYC